MTEAILHYHRKPDPIVKHGKAARLQIESSFSMEAMTKGYLQVYYKALGPQHLEQGGRKHVWGYRRTI